MASGNRNKSIKHSPDLFSDDAQTASEQILAALELEQQQKNTISDFSQIPQPLPQPTADFPEEDTRSAEQQVDFLLDKYYNGDRDVDIKHRYDNKSVYKQQLIELLQQYGIKYVEQYHYPLGKDEKHLIRMDFYGTINHPQHSKLSPSYREYLKYGKNITAESKFNNTVSAYPLSSYDLSTSPSWALFRLFPRFQKLERRLTKTLQAMQIPPQQLSEMSVYDFSDALYRAHRKTEDSSDAHLFLGARQAFVKDLFLKNEKWLRAYLTRKNVHPRYINALIKAAKGRGITGNINISSDANTYMCEYAVSHSNDFQKFINSSIKSDNYAADIKQQIQDDAYNLQGSTLAFLQNNRQNFENFIRKQLSENCYADTVLQQFNRTTPPYVINDIKAFVTAEPELFKQFLAQKYLNADSLYGQITHNTTSLTPKQQKILTAFAEQHQDSFFVSLLDNSRSPDYARFAIASLSPVPVLNDYAKDTVRTFIIDNERLFSRQVSAKTFNQIKAHGISDENLLDIVPFIQKNGNKFKTHFKNNNILTFDELQNELSEAFSSELETTSLSVENQKFYKNFALGNEDLFKNWYIRFHTQEYRRNAAKTYSTIANSGINADNEDVCGEFIKERMGNFVEFIENKNLDMAQTMRAIHNGNLSNNPELAQVSHDFIVKYNSAFKNYLLQKRLKDKEKNFEITIKKIKSQGMTQQSASLIHKFIVDNQALFLQSLEQGKQLNNQTQKIYSRICGNRGTVNDKSILKAFLNANIYDYLVFQQDDAQRQPYTQNIINNIKQMKIGSVEHHWLRTFTVANKDNFLKYMESQSETEASCSEDIFNNIKFEKGNMKIKFDDGYVLSMNLTVHHRRAVKDRGDKTSSLESIAETNSFANLCLVVETWHRILHALDGVEPVEDKERIVSRLVPMAPNLVFYGGENPEDQLSYDYAHDERTQKQTQKIQNEIEIIRKNKFYENYR